MPLMSLSTRIAYTVDELAQLAAVALPQRVKYWATMQSMAHATREYPEHVMGASMQYIIDHLDKPADRKTWDKVTKYCRDDALATETIFQNRPKEK
jgi:hypothetical protein